MRIPFCFALLLIVWRYSRIVRLTGPTEDVQLLVFGLAIDSGNFLTGTTWYRSTGSDTKIYKLILHGPKTKHMQLMLFLMILLKSVLNAQRTSPVQMNIFITD